MNDRDLDDQLLQELRTLRSTLDDRYKKDVADLNALGRIQLRKRKTLRGHLAKIYSLQWGTDSRHLVSASQDGKLMVWDTYSTKKINAVYLKCSWVLACAYSPSQTRVASGGLDNICSVFGVREYNASQANNGPLVTPPTKELVGHTGYISSCKFLDDSQILTSSGDQTCALWDIETGQKHTSFENHSAEVMSVSLSPDRKTYFISGSCDGTAKLWDIRDGLCRQTFSMIDGLPGLKDVNGVDFHPSGLAFASASEDAVSRVFDIRNEQQLLHFAHDRMERSNTVAASCVAFSRSGRLLFAGHDDGICEIWDGLKGGRAGALTDHEGKVSCAGVAPEGGALATGSWDCYMHITS